MVLKLADLDVLSFVVEMPQQKAGERLRGLTAPCPLTENTDTQRQETHRDTDRHLTKLKDALCRNLLLLLSQVP